MNKNTVRLPNHIKPLRYKITLKPDLESFTFVGNETIKVVLSKPTKEITLHSKELEIDGVEFIHSGKTNIVSKISYDSNAETASFLFKQKLPKGRGELKLVFRGILNDKMRGFYRSSYEHQGRQKHLAVSQFEATDARRAFPCFDEPALKAVFEISLVILKHHTAISNTLETSVVEHEGGYKIVNFAPSPKMSTYLVALISGEFEFIQGKTKNGVLVRVWATPGKKHQAKFALSTAIKCLEFYNKYFGISYPLPALDLIAIPDFSHGAMENWGAVTYRESALLVDPEHSSSANKQWVALVIAHELAHQWFGNLVTMQWWTHLWLNEGFASYMEYLAVDNIFPQWEIFTQFAYNDLGVALRLDSLKNTHPIEVEVHHPDEIGEIFDEVSYSKGASIIRMLAAYLGEDNFRKGLRHYLKSHSYNNASTQQLWEAFEKISNKPVSKIMRTWTGKPGYPVLRIIEGKKHLQITQARFFSNPISKKQSQDTTIWPVPLNYVAGKQQKMLLNNRQNLKIAKLKSGWFKFNAEEKGFYRVDYPSQMLAALQNPIRNKELGAIDRLGIIRDAFALSEAGQLPALRALELAKSYLHEDNYTVWVELAAGLAAVSNLIFDLPYYNEYKKFCLGLFTPLAKKVGWKKLPGESHTAGLLRSLALYNAGLYGDNLVIKKAKRLFANFVPADLRGVVYALAAENGGEKEYKIFIKKYKTEQLQEEKGRIGRALGHFNERRILIQALNFSISRYVRYQDTAGIINSIAGNPKGRQLAWEFVKQNWNLLLHRYPSSGHILSKFLKPFSGFSDKKWAKDLKKFFERHPAPAAARTIQQVLEKIYGNSKWLERENNHFRQWLSK